MPIRIHGQAHRKVATVRIGFARYQSKLECLVLFGDESGRADFDEGLLDEDLEVLRGRHEGACHHPDGIVGSDFHAWVEPIAVDCFHRHLWGDLNGPDVGFSRAAS